MNRRNKHISFLSAVILACCLCLLSGFQVSAQPNGNVRVSSTQVRKNVLLRYSKIPNRERFYFDFPGKSKISYEIKNEKNATTIIFHRLFRLDTQNLTDFPLYTQIVQKKTPDNRLEVTFPLALQGSAEHLNTIVFDFYPAGVIADDQQAQPARPLQIASLGFSWNAPVALSVFKRGKYLWAVFNQYQQINTNELIKAAGGLVKDIIQLPHTSATILRIETTNDLCSETRKEGLLWIIDLYSQKIEHHAKEIEIKADTTLIGKPHLQVYLPHTEDIFSFFDPDIGDILMAITSSEPGYAFVNGYKYADFEFLPTSQGMAINSDDFALTLIRNLQGFMIRTTNHPLNLSKDDDKLKQQAALQIGNNDVNIIQELTMPILRKTFADSENFLKLQIDIAPEEDKNKFRYDLARFYLSYGLGSNALGVLRDIKKALKKDGKNETPRLKGLIGVASFFMKRYDIAFDFFSDLEVNKSPEIELWRIMSDNDKNKDHTPDILKNIHFIHSYPMETKRLLIMRGIDYATQKGNDALTQVFLTMMKEIPVDEELFAATNFYEAEKIRLQGYMKNALAFYKAAALSKSQKFSSLGRLKIAEFNSKIADVKPKRIIQEFERLRFAWGEREFKLKVLNTLVDLYLRETNFYMALKTLNDIRSSYAGQKSAVEQRMIQLMEEIYYYNNDNQFNPIKALALFEDFGYLIERSDFRSAIIIKLSDRLVAIDLLERAYRLLSSYRKANEKDLSHQEISAMGGRMALIDLFRGDDVSALHDLRDTDYEDVPEALKLQRRIIEAKAYVMQSMPEKALKLLQDETSRNAILLKAEIYWNAEQWSLASDMLRLLVDKPKAGEPLSEEQIRYILDWLTALKQAGKETVIVRVHNTFLPYFENTPYLSMFNLLSGYLEKDKISVSDIDQTIQNVQAFSDFAKQYTKSLMSENLKEKNEDK